MIKFAKVFTTTTTAVVVGLVSFLGTSGAQAAPTFTDTSSSQFQNEIGWLASQGITTGYADGSFLPREAITREAMAAFLHRYDNDKTSGNTVNPPQQVDCGAGRVCSVFS